MGPRKTTAPNSELRPAGDYVFFLHGGVPCLAPAEQVLGVRDRVHGEVERLWNGAAKQGKVRYLELVSGHRTLEVSSLRTQHLPSLTVFQLPPLVERALGARRVRGLAEFEETLVWLLSFEAEAGDE